MKSPILLLIYNRPDKTAILLEAIREYRPTKVYIAADGPKIDKDIDVIRTTRRVASKIDWKCEVFTLFREVNLGCKVAVSSAIDWFFEAEEMGIILEDDCLPDSSFFLLCEELLSKYKENDKVGMIAGTNQFSNQLFNVEESYFFGTNASIWGWASWRRAWEHYDVNMTQWPKLRKERGFLRSYSSNMLERLRRQAAYDDVYSNRIDTWDYQWTFARQKAGLLCIIPSANLVENIGMDGGGTHLKNSNYVGQLKSKPLEFPLRHPVGLSVNREFDRLLSGQIVSEGMIRNILYLMIKRPFKNYLLSER